MSKLATENELTYKQFFKHMKAEIGYQLSELGDHSPLKDIDIRIAKDDRDDEHETRFIHVTCKAQAGASTHHLTRIEFTRTNPYGYGYNSYRTTRKGQRLVKVDRSGRFESRKTFPQRKDGTFSFDKIAIQAISELESQILAAERYQRMMQGIAKAEASRATLSEQFGLTEYNSIIRARKDGNLNLSFTELSESQTEAMLAAAKQIGGIIK